MLSLLLLYKDKSITIIKSEMLHKAALNNNSVNDTMSIETAILSLMLWSSLNPAAKQTIALDRKNTLAQVTILSRLKKFAAARDKTTRCIHTSVIMALMGLPFLFIYER
ncbi:hypothetical protein [Clostridium sp. 001]|uniref:hypothetical protein n=1 Tax=Clostridium sp. 001 TaxID=1970093 RepID=UPI0020B807F4|nr:hypothetical protein [Clostridium sp. 001]